MKNRHTLCSFFAVRDFFCLCKNLKIKQKFLLTLTINYDRIIKARNVLYGTGKQMTNEQKTRILKAKRALFDKYYDFLNPEQRRAVYTVNGPVLILAGAGSGKTTVLVNRIAHIVNYGDAYFSNEIPESVTEDAIEDLEGAISLPKEIIKEYLSVFAKNPCPVWGILAITFTNKAANEIKSRLEKLTSYTSSDASDFWTGTFHSVCMRILRRHGDLLGYNSNVSVCDADDSKKLISKCMKDLNISDKILPVKTVMNEISRAKDVLMTPPEYEKQAGSDEKYGNIAKIYTLYQKRLESSNLLDFDDIIMKTVQLFKEHEDVLAHYQNKFRYVSVDEYQDTNKAQFELVRLISGFYRNIMVVGDDDQSIYKFRGATIENILNFDETYPDAAIIKLEQNYRSTSNILNAANSLICRNFHKHPKKLWCMSESGDKITVKELASQNDESRYVTDEIERLKNKENLTYKDFAVLYRVNAQSLNLETIFAKSGIPYRMLGALRFYDRKEVKDIISYLSIINNPSDSVRLRRIVNEPKRKIGDASFDAASKIAEELGVPTLEILGKAAIYNAIPKSTAGSMMAFASMIKELTEEKEKLSLSDFAKKVIRNTGYENMLILGGSAEKERLDNLDALCAAVREYENSNENPTLAGFLEEVALVSDADRYDESADAVTLMTIHSAKGLEFPVVFIPGMEDGVFPGQQSINQPDELEEERRLAYVAITRAKKKLIITHTKERMLYGMTQRNPVSRFIKEIDPRYLDIQKENSVFAPSPDFKKTYSEKSFFQYKKPKAEANDITVYSVGDRVKHTVFGEGMILSVTKMSSDYMYEIAFDNVGTKRLMATYVSKLLTKI